MLQIPREGEREYIVSEGQRKSGTRPNNTLSYSALLLLLLWVVVVVLGCVCAKTESHNVTNPGWLLTLGNPLADIRVTKHHTSFTYPFWM